MCGLLKNGLMRARRCTFNILQNDFSSESAAENIVSFFVDFNIIQKFT